MGAFPIKNTSREDRLSCSAAARSAAWWFFGGKKGLCEREIQLAVAGADVDDGAREAVYQVAGYRRRRTWRIDSPAACFV